MQTLVANELSVNRNANPYLVIDNVSKVYPTTKGDFTVLENISLTVYEGEFVCVIGHSGCGKSTLLNMVSGFTKPTLGEVRLESKVITKPGPDRMVVFQNYSLLPWLSALDNVALAIKSVHPETSKSDRLEMAMASLEMVGLTETAFWRDETTRFDCKGVIDSPQSLDFRRTLWRFRCSDAGRTPRGIIKNLAGT
jgi:ABC-type Fe3+/spermidine/putrescine transport system ATPase subunit